MWTRRIRDVIVLAVLFGGMLAPGLHGQGASKERQDRKDKDSEKGSSGGPEKVIGSFRVSLTGILSNEVPASDTTGVELSVEEARGITWELELSKEKDLQALARKLSGKRVAAKGVLDIREGRMRKVRFIVRTTELKAAEARK